MAKAAASSNKRNPSPAPLLARGSGTIIDYLTFAWLGTQPAEYDEFRKHFCKEVLIDLKEWSYFQEDTGFYDYIKKRVSPPKKVILVTVGRLCKKLLKDLHDCEQLDSVFIYCRYPEKYEHLPESYHKIRGIHFNPVQLLDGIKNHLDRKEEERLATLLTNGHSSDIDEIESTPEKDIIWNPWEGNSCVRALPMKGQVTIAMLQNCSVPFKIILSNASRLTSVVNENSHSIVFHVSHQEVKLKIYIAGQPHMLDYSEEVHEVLQKSNKQEENVYWISFSRESSTIMCGLGEIRPKFGNFEAHLDSKQVQCLSTISYIHVQINETYQNLEKIDYLKDQIRLAISWLPFLEPKLLVSCQPHSSDLHSLSSKLSLSTLPEACRLLYYNLSHFKFEDDTFPEFLQAIEYSMQNPDGWCHKKLLEKANRFGRSRRETSSLRLQLDPVVIEIWPAGHHSPIHHHKNAYGMFRVLHGSIAIHLFPALTLDLQHRAPIEYILRENEYTWMSPKFNQTHQMRNVEPESCCVLIQCYHYEGDHETKRHEETFDYIVNSGHDIQSMKPPSDMHFGLFQEKIREEWEKRQQT